MPAALAGFQVEDVRVVEIERGKAGHPGPAGRLQEPGPSIEIVDGTLEAKDKPKQDLVPNLLVMASNGHHILLRDAPP